MKVITEERLIEKFKLHYWKSYDGADLLEKLLAECKEIDTVTVSKLRPMSDKPIIPDGKLQVFVLVYFSHTEIPSIVSFDTRQTWPHEAYHGIGWSYLPVIKPEEMIWPDACG